MRSTRSWPRGFTDLLLKTVLLPEPQARAAWRTWSASRNFDDVNWHEMRLLLPLAARLETLDRESPLRPRINGLAKNLWTQTQLKLRETAAAFDCLIGAGIPFIVFKGGAQHAEGLAFSSRRVMGDVDILVRPNRAVAALDALEAGGWSATNGESFQYLRELAAVRLSGNFKRGRYGEIDLHITPFHYARIVASLDEALWTRAVPAKLAGRSILVPDPTDSMLLHLAHSAVSRGGDWAIDVATRIERQPIDWDWLVRIAHQRGLVPACRAALDYLVTELAVAVPPQTMRALSALPVPFGERLKYWSNVNDRSERNLLEKLGNRLADRLLRHQGFSLVVKDRRAISVVRPAFPLRWLFGRGRQLPVGATAMAVEQTTILRSLPDRSRIVLRLSFPLPARSRRLFFDVSANGVGVARFRTRAGGGRGKPVKSALFHLALPSGLPGDTQLLIAARPVRFVPPDAAGEELADLAPVPFRIDAAWVI